MIDGVAFYKHLRVPLRDRQAAIAAYRAGHFIPVDPLDGTRIKQAITLGNPDKIVYAPRGVFDFKALIPDKGPRSLNKEEPPMLQPSVTYQWEEVRWVDEGQPRTERARDVDGLPVSPKTWPKLGEFSYDELERVVAWAGRELGSGCVE